MKTKLLSLFVVLFFISVSGVCAQNSPIIGKWRVIEKRAGFQKTMSKMNSKLEQIKIITANSFFWITYNKSDGDIIQGAGGICEIGDGKYTEIITKSLSNMEKFINKKAVYDFDVNGNKLHIKGILANNIPIEEIWQRIE